MVAAAGFLGYAAFLALDFLLPANLPATLREDRFRLSRAPQVYEQPKGPSYLELTDGSTPARIPNFNFIGSDETKSVLLALKPGTEVIVFRPGEATDWLSPFDVVAVKVGDNYILNREATKEAHRSRLSSSRTVLLWLGCAGIATLAIRRLLPVAHAA